MAQAARAPGRLERRKARTRAAIVAAAAELFQTRGYDATSIQQIAERADTGVGTLYGYFASKDDVLREVLFEARGQVLAEYLSTIDSRTTPIDRLCRALETLGAYLRNNRRLLMAVFQASVRDRPVDEEQAQWLHDQYAEIISEGIARGELRAVPLDAAVRMLVTTYMTAWLGIGAWKGREDDPALRGELEELVRALLLPV